MSALVRPEDILAKVRQRLRQTPRALTLTEINQKINWWQGERSRAVALRLSGHLSAQELKAHLKKYRMELTVLRRMRFETIKRMKRKLIK